ncbi:MAG: RHS repeat-associated core domain-containing protein [Actinobacteria bacterium]|nr:RHS repeat-associated core domain-containing protein [Actinomycetota bacterium]
MHEYGSPHAASVNSLDGSAYYVNRHIYDELGRLAETEYAIPAASYDPGTYDRGCNLGMKEVRYEDYNLLGQPTRIIEYLKDGGVYRVAKVTERAFSPQGDLASETVRDGADVICSLVTYEYDPQGRMTLERKWRNDAEAQERRLSYVNEGISRFKPACEYLSHHREGSTVYYEKRTTTFFYDGQTAAETSAELGHFSGSGFVVDDSSQKLTVSYSYHGGGTQAGRLHEKVTTGPRELGEGGALISGELERRRYAWNLNGLPAYECLVVGGAEVNKSVYGYDSLFRETARFEQVTYARGDGTLETRQVVTKYAYDPSGNRTLERPPGSGPGTRREYDLAGRVVKETDPSGAVKRYSYDLAGNLTGEIVEKWEGGEIVTTHAYDALSREVMVTRPNPDDPSSPILTSYSYGANAKRAETYEEKNPSLKKAVDYLYDPLGRLLSEKRHYEGGVAETLRAYDRCGNEVSLREPDTAEKVKEYDLAGRLLKVTARGVDLGERDGQGEPMLRDLTLEEYAYDPAGRKASSRAPYGSGASWEGTLTTYAYDGLSRELRVTQELEGENAVTSHAWEYEVVGAGAAVSHAVVSPEGLLTEMLIDQRGREIKRTLRPEGYPAREIWTAIGEYGEADGDNLRVETSHGPAPDAWTRREYDAAGRVARVSDAAGGEAARTYNERGLLTRETVRVDEDTTAVTCHAYDDLARETMTCRGYNGQGNPMEPRYFAYDIFGRKVSEWDAASAGRPAAFSYDLLDHLTAEARPIDGDTVLVKNYKRDRAGRMLSLSLATDTTPVREITYSGLGHPLAVVSHPGPAEDITVTYAWDAAGRMTRETDGAGNAWTYAYNRLGLLAESRDPLYDEETHPYAARMAYDREGRMTASVVSDGATAPDIVSSLSLTWLPTGEVDTRSFSDGAGGYAQEDYEYDDYGRLTSVSCPSGVTLSYSDYDPCSRPRALTFAMGGKTYSQTLSYTEGGALSSVTLPAGTTSYGYDDQGRLAHAEGPQGSFYRFHYDCRGLLQALSLPGEAGEMAWTYTLDGRPSSVSLTPRGEASPSASLSYSYDAYGKVVTMTRHMETADPASGTYAYAYDRLGRLTGADGPSAMPDYSYAYDPRGPLSRKTETPPAGDPVVTAYAYDAAGRLSFEYRPSDPAAHLTDYSWDPAGRMVSASGERGISSLAWDGLSRLVSAATPGDGGTERVSSYAYDHLGRMLAREEREDGASSSTLLLPFALTRETAALYDPEGEGPGALLFSFLSGPSGTRLAQTDHRKDPGETTHPFRSPRGDVLALLDRDGNPTRTYAYSPYGETEEGYSEEGTPFLFQDDYLDPETSLYHMQARWYDPCSSSFLSPDPEMGEASDPQARLPYAYCAGDPVYNSDPSGRRLIEGEDESGRMITWAPTSFLRKYTAGRGETMSGYYRRKTQERNIRKALAKATAALTGLARPSDLSEQTIAGLTAAGIDPLSFKRHMFSQLQEAVEDGRLGKVHSMVIDMGESHLFTEQDLRYFLSRTNMNRAMQEAYVQVFHEAEQGAFDTPYLDFVGAWRSGRLSLNLTANLGFVEFNINISHRGWDTDMAWCASVPGASFTASYDPYPEKKIIRAQSMHAGYFAGGGVEFVTYEDGCTGIIVSGGATWGFDLGWRGNPRHLDELER